MKLWLLFLLLVLDVPLFLYLGKLFYGDLHTCLEELVDFLRTAPLPWWVREATGVEQGGDIRVLLWLLACVAIAAAEYMLIVWLFG